MFILDEHFSPKLVNRLKDIYPGLTQTYFAGMLGYDDNVIWEYAVKNKLHIVTKDYKDFKILSKQFGPPPKLVILRIPNCKVSSIEYILRTKHKEIIQFFNNDNAVILEYERAALIKHLKLIK